jgi:glyoxylase I family protein
VTNVQRLHHVAYRCKDAKETVEFYTKFLGMPFSIALADNRVPSTKEWSPHIHIFFEMQDGSSLAFFEVPEAPGMKLDPNTPEWVQHLAMKVADMDTLLDFKKKLEDGGVNVVGPTNHGICQSIYFFDPSGHRMELAVDTSTPKMMARLEKEALDVLDVWARTKTAGDSDFGWLHHESTT